MKNTTFRKKALLSSVAMLLVALVALGSATFAWFTANPKANAAGLDLKTTASTGLVVRTDSDDQWSHAAALYKGQSAAFDLTPVSQDQSTSANFWTVDAAESSKYGAGTDAMTPASVGTYQAPGAVYSEKIYFRLSDGSATDANSTQNVVLTNIAITKDTAATMENTIRVAVADKNNHLLGTWALSTAGANGTLTTANKTAGNFNPALAVAGAVKDAEGKDIVVAAGKDLSADGADLDEFVTVYVYLDGQDSDCYSDKVGTVNATKIIDSIQIDFKLQ